MKTINTTRLVVFDNANTTIKVIGDKEQKFNEWKYQRLIFDFLGKHEFKRVWIDNDDSQSYEVDFNKLKELKLV